MRLTERKIGYPSCDKKVNKMLEKYEKESKNESNNDCN